LTESSGVNVEFVVLDLDGDAMLEECLSSITSQSVKARRVVVYDNGSRAPVSGRIDAAQLEVTILRSETNIGVARGFNEAIRECQSDYVALVNNDVVLDARWLESMVEAIESDERIAAVQSIIVQRGGATIDGTGIAFVEGRVVQRDHGLALEAASRSAPWGISATAALYRRSALQDVARVDDEVFLSSFFAYYEDVELAARLRAREWTTALVPVPLAAHRGSSTASSLGSRGERIRVRNRYWLARLHKGCGSIPALLVEDMKRMIRLVAGGRLLSVLWTKLGILEGLFGSPGVPTDKSGELG